ncbi:MAG: hypothetical protein ACI89L_001142 [Phycisphaerales bacterium]|jgi:hypothetical protein
MNQLLQFIQSIPIQVWVLVAVFGFSVLGQVGKSMSTIKQKRRLDQERQKRADESMRTGRPVPDPAQAQATEIEARRQRLAEMQQRRQAQLDELRKRRQEMIGRQAAPQARTSAPPARQPVPPVGPQIGPQTGSHQVARATPGPRQAPRPAPQQAPRFAPQPVSRPVPTVGSHPGSHSVSQAAGPKPTGLKPTRQPHSTIHASESLGDLGGHKMKLGAVSAPFQHAIEDAGTTGNAGLAKHGIRLEGREDLRRAIILSEILAKPVTMRPDRLTDFD